MSLNAPLREITAARLSARARTASTSATRVAARYLAANEQQAYDLVVRLLILEGAAGVRPMAWANGNLRRNLIRAKAHIEDEHPDILDVWFDVKNTGGYQVIDNRLRGLFRSYRVTDESDRTGVLHSALWGLGTKGDQGELPLYRAGLNLKEKILGGKETPKSVCAGLAGKFIVRKALSVLATLKRRQNALGQRTDVHEMGDIVEDPSFKNKKPFGKMFMNILTDPSNKVGEDLRDFIRSTYAGSTQEPAASLFFEHLFETGGFKSRTDIVLELGWAGRSDPKRLQSQQVRLRNQLNLIILPRIGKMIRGNTQLFGALQDEVIRLGGEAIIPSDIEEVFAGAKAIKWDKLSAEAAARYANLADEVRAILG